MFWRRPAAGTPAYEPKRCPDGASPSRATPLLPKLPTPDVGTGRGAAGTWWQDRGRLPYLSPGVPYGPRGRGTLRALLLPPLLQSGMVRGAGTRGTRQPAARDDPDAVGALLGEFLPTKFRDFLHQLRAKCAEPEAHREAVGTGVGGVGKGLGSPVRTVPSSPGFPPLPLLLFFLLLSRPPSPRSTLNATVPQGCIRALPRFPSFQQLIPPRSVVSGEMSSWQRRGCPGCYGVGPCSHRL